MSNEKTDKNRKMYVLIAISAMVCFFIVFAFLFSAYLSRFDRQLLNENEVYLSEISNDISVHMTTVMTDTLSALKAVSSGLMLLDSEQKRMRYLAMIAEQYAFTYIGYAESDGVLRATLPSESVIVNREPYFRAALRGESTVSNQIRKIFRNRAASGVLLAVPLGEGSTSGVLVALLETKVLRDVLNLETFGGEGYAYVIDQNGMVIMRTRSLDFGNLFMAWRNLHFKDGHSLNQLIRDITVKRDGVASFTNVAGDEQYIYYKALSFNDWAVVNVVSEQIVSAKSASLTQEITLIGGSMLLLFMCLMLWSLRSYSASRESRLAAEAKSAFLANMSHEIRTPMNAIVGLSEIMLRDETRPANRDQLMSILNSSKGLLTILNDILDISKIESGSFTIVDEPYELESLFYDLTIISVIRIGERPLQFLIELENDLPHRLIGDMGRVKQVLLNIVGNAIKFTKEGSIRLLVNCAQDDQGWLLRVEVRDTGVGIKPEDLSKMFVRFSQVDTKRNRNIEGTGLGLTISQKLCEMMGGSITVTSEYGRGSSFVITVRQGVDDLAPLVRSVPSALSLLLCEDSELLRTFEATCMDRLGLPYIFCTNSDMFQEKLRTGKYTHALAPRAVLRRLPPELVGTTQLISLLALQDHTLVDAEGTSIYVPLFSIQLPYALSGETEYFRTAKRATVDTAVIEPMPYVSVLIVDDNELNIMVAEGVMAPYEMELDHAISGKEALFAVQTRDYDLVLMDHMMPEMDGVEATRLIRELPDEKYRKLPIIALTANTTSEARQMFLENGFNEFLAKPIETSRLNKILKHWLKEVNDQRHKLARGDAPEEICIAKREFAVNGLRIVSTGSSVRTKSARDSRVADERLLRDARLSSETASSQTLDIRPLSDTPPATAAPPAAELDFKEGQRRMPSDAFYRKILASYVHSTGEKLSVLPEWMDIDPNRVVIEVHGLKSASASIGALRLSETAQKLELHGKEERFDELRAGLPAFIEQGRRAIAEIEAYLESRAD